MGIGTPYPKYVYYSFYVIFRHKICSDGYFEHYKARFVGDGRSQQVLIVMRRLAMWLNPPLYD